MSPGVRPVTLDGGGIPLSGLLAEPVHVTPRAAVVALHGGGLTAEYFDGQAHPDLSLLTLGAQLGFTVLALDRPGYGRSAAFLPEGQTLAEQATTAGAAIEDFARGCATGAGILLLGHSYGGKLALRLGADALLASLLALDVSGCGHRFAADRSVLGQAGGIRQRHLNWGPLRHYPPSVFRAGSSVVAAMPRREAEDAANWPQICEGLLPHVRVPVRLTFAEHEAWWHHSDEDVADLVGLLTAAPRVVVERLPDAGHNISLGWAARTYHLRALAFFEEAVRSRHRVAAADAGPVAALQS
ncbi:alpha/beta hydrolase [Streptomyces colonosanans]|uniref:Alpha/beta hydrolase n=1 Tax=Streptomyces colonosanans TaxID=1428652 RepID=A0A1S2P4M7_9ACTN|nr:alpha/beta hydrolase [Streptomyces colonosanans]OIJ88601.1 alpha/beta hydrolase [Streptomyces colonosanans]